MKDLIILIPLLIIVFVEAFVYKSKAWQAKRERFPFHNQTAGTCYVLLGGLFYLIFLLSVCFGEKDLNILQNYMFNTFFLIGLGLIRWADKFYLKSIFYLVIIACLCFILDPFFWELDLKIDLSDPILIHLALLFLGATWVLLRHK